uniref:site-specific DNA-methyltransferase (cytosine-N(4)-specific) n=1 Tax=viral metagenome TaxID=1070528 RepID=A0A6M3LD59_9ZZZZ
MNSWKEKYLNKIVCCDCLEGIKDIPDKSIDMVLTSPPYNMRTRIRNGQYTTREKSEHFSKKYHYFNDALPIEEFYTFHSKILSILLRISKIVCYNFQIVTGSKEVFFRIIGDFSREIKDIIVWDKGRGQPAMHEQVLNSCYEMILIFENDGRCGRAIQNAQFQRGTMDNILRIGRGKAIKLHRAVFPEKLALILINAFSNKKDIILDPFIGSGTTALAAKQLNRNFIGMEISEEYCKIARQRTAQETLGF